MYKRQVESEAKELRDWVKDKCARPTGLDARLASFLFVVLLVVPVYGQLFPKRVPFLTAYRPYAGNWCFSWHVVAGAAAAKLAKLDVLDGTVLLSENAKLLWGSGNPHLCEQMEDYVTGILTCFPAYRPVVPMVEQLKAARGWAGHGDCLVLNQEMLGNHVFGFCLGTGFLVKGDGYLDALRETCGFESGECFLIVCEPAGLLDHTVEWRAVDVATKETVIRGAAPYAQKSKSKVAALDALLIRAEADDTDDAAALKRVFQLITDASAKAARKGDDQLTQNCGVLTRWLLRRGEGGLSSVQASRALLPRAPAASTPSCLPPRRQ